MRWIKVAAVVGGAIVVFVVIESIWHLIQMALIGIVIVAVIAVAIKARQAYKARISEGQRKRQERQLRKTQERAPSIEASRSIPTSGIPTSRTSSMPSGVVTPSEGMPVSKPAQRDVDDELARMKREMGV